MDEQTRLPVLIDAGRTEVAVPAYSGTIPKDRWPKRSPWTDSAANQIAVASTLSAYDVISLNVITLAAALPSAYVKRRR